MSYSRRTFVKKATIASCSLPLLFSPFKSTLMNQNQVDLDISIFSKHLQFLDLKDAGQVAAELGFNGIDLTVRPKGHVLPKEVSSSLKKAINDIEGSGSSCKLITTVIEDVQNPEDKAIIKTAGELGVKFYRTNWFKYLENKTMIESLEIYQKKVEELGKFNSEHDIIGCYQNHAGTKVGGSFWEIEKLLETVDSDSFGVQYDIRHAVAEGGYSWENGLRLLHKRIKVIVLKDFKWGKVNGEWKPINVPIGQGMVDFTKYFKLLKFYGLKPPVSLHLEYPLGGAENGSYSISIDKAQVFNAMKNDLSAIRTLWLNA